MIPPIVIVAPCFNENTTVIKFLDELDSVLGRSNQKFLVVVVDDCSFDNTINLLSNYSFKSENLELKVIVLKFNQGHQSAIYQGLCYAHSKKANRVIVMDSDGEDDPNAILDLLNSEYEEFDIINVERGKRKEKFSFRLFYRIYKMIFYFITGRSLKFGNFCMINKKILESTVHTSFIHFAAHLSKQKAKRGKIRFDRRLRLDGKSKMNLTGLIHHAFKSFIEYAEELLMVFLKLFILIVVTIGIVVSVVIYKKLFTDSAILGWASTLSASLIGIAVLCLGFFVIGILLLNIMAKKGIEKAGTTYVELN